MYGSAVGLIDMNRNPGRPSVIYMSYDGVLEPLGESQVVAYLEILADVHNIHLISFEKPDDADQPGRMDQMERRLRKVGITWHPLRYHKRPRILSTMWDMVGAMLLGMRLARRHDARLLHARSVLCAAMLYPAKRVSNAQFLVDIRGFWADERVDGGMIRAGGPVFSVLKFIEKAMMREADHIVTLTHASVPYLRTDLRLGQTSAPISVISTCADLDLFSPTPRNGQPRPLTIGYVGQIGTWYMLDEMLAFFAAIRRLRGDARLLIVNKNQQDVIRQALAKTDIDPEVVEITASSRQAMPVQIRRMDAGLALIRPYFSKIASAPTKFAEYLGCGVPVVGNAGCGDMVRIIENDQVGVAMADTSPEAIELAAQTLLYRLQDKALSDRCVTSAHRHFALEDGASRYRAIYGSLLGEGA